MEHSKKASTPSDSQEGNHLGIQKANLGNGRVGHYLLLDIISIVPQVLTLTNGHVWDSSLCKRLHSEAAFLRELSAQNFFDGSHKT
jgi:hypothetical protein